VSLLKSEQLTASHRAGKLTHLLLFDGPEAWLKRRAVHRIIEQYLPPEARDLNLDRLDANDCSAADVITPAMSLPFLSEKRIIVVQSPDEFSAADSKAIGAVLPRLPASTILIFLVNGKAGLREEIPAHVNSAGAVVTFWTPFPNQLPGWIVEECRSRGCVISFDAARILGEACGDLEEISGELDKLILYVGKKKKIDASDIYETGIPGGTGDFRDLEKAAWNRDLGQTLNQVRLLSEMGIRAEMIFPVFERIFRTLILARYYKDGKGWGIAEIYSTLGFRGRTRQALLDNGLRLYHSGEIKESLNRIIQAHMDLKTGVLPGDLACTLLALALLGKQKAGRLALR